uniref:Uncharacterized protein n=1 Tax=Arundo donax TaxID=35708 RepID=A0A0A9HE82_ARUDO
MQDLDAGAVRLLDLLPRELPPVHLQHGDFLLEHDPQVLLVRERQHNGNPERPRRQGPRLPYQLPHVIRGRPVREADDADGAGVGHGGGELGAGDVRPERRLHDAVVEAQDAPPCGPHLVAHFAILQLLISVGSGSQAADSKLPDDWTRRQEVGEVLGHGQ